MRLSSQAGRVLLRPRPRGETDDWGVRGRSDCGTGTKGGSHGPIGAVRSEPVRIDYRGLTIEDAAEPQQHHRAAPRRALIVTMHVTLTICVTLARP